MGNFSFLRADDDESISSSGDEVVTIHNPDKGKNLTGIYDGYGRNDVSLLD
jgi:hypothetical protein